MQLIIAEKPSLGRAIAQILPTPHTSHQGYIQCGNDTIVTWCTGHLLEPCGPEAYQPKYAKWNLLDLPVAPTSWKLSPRSDTMTHLQVIGSLIEGAQQIIHAGDPDREGQLMVDEVLNYFNVQLPVQRLLVNDLTPSAIQSSFNQLEVNTKYHHLSLSAQCRQRADWLYGINLTRAITLIERDKGKEGVFSVGRVQTPVLGLVVSRDFEIEHFKPIRYFSVDASFDIAIPTETCSNASNNTITITTQWQTPPSRQMHCDEQGRLLNRKIAERVVKTTSSQEQVTPDALSDKPIGNIKNITSQRVNTPPPHPFSLSTLQIEAAEKYGYSPQFVLDGCQLLYDKHRLITYPKSDNRHLPEIQFEHRTDLLNRLILNLPELAEPIHHCDLSLKSNVWNDQKTGPHHGIVPTQKTFDCTSLQERERNLYKLICLNYIAQFYPDHIIDNTSIDIIIGHELFKGTKTATIQYGWGVLFNHFKEQPPTSFVNLKDIIQEGEQINGHSIKVVSHETYPPIHFDEASLLSAMTHIAPFVKDPHIKKTLRESDGLGTEATRGSIIEALFRRNYIIKNGKRIISTDKGKELILNLPVNCITPDMTAIWEAALNTISSGSTKPADFIARITDEISQLIETLTGTPIAKSSGNHQTIPQPPSCPKCQSEMIERSGKYGRFWACSQFPSCKASLPWRLNTTKKAKAVRTGDSPPIPCPNCHAPLIRRSGSRGDFWGCSNYPSCRKTFKDIEGKPHIPINPRP